MEPAPLPGALARAGRGLRIDGALPPTARRRTLRNRTYPSSRSDARSGAARTGDITAVRLTIQDVQNAVVLYEMMHSVEVEAEAACALAGLSVVEGRAAHIALCRVGLGGRPPGWEQFTPE